jgi:hypothetical protein
MRRAPGSGLPLRGFQGLRTEPRFGSAACDAIVTLARRMGVEATALHGVAAKLPGV